MSNEFFPGFRPGVMASRAMACLALAAALLGADVQAQPLLFSSHDMMEVAVPIDFKTLCHPREAADCDYTPTELEYADQYGERHVMPIEVIIRGGWRSLARNCSAPLLFIRFDQGSTAGTPFEGQTLLPLTTHCGQGLSIEANRFREQRTDWEQYLLKEYLAHRLYNVITPVSLNARLVQITYPNPDKPNRKIRSYAFFTEHFDAVAARNGQQVIARGGLDPEKLDMRVAGLVALFQFMIGNTDWSIMRERNIILLQDPAGAQLPLPYDFDMSGLVDAQYAGPAPNLPIKEVRDRHFLGFCSPGLEQDSLYEPYLENKEALLSLVKTVPGLDRKSVKSTLRYLQEFFEILESEELRTKQIVNQCKPGPLETARFNLPTD